VRSPGARCKAVSPGFASPAAAFSLDALRRPFREYDDVVGFSR
jgi:hypothetical protein